MDLADRVDIIWQFEADRRVKEDGSQSSYRIQGPLTSCSADTNSKTGLHLKNLFARLLTSNAHHYTYPHTHFCLCQRGKVETDLSGLRCEASEAAARLSKICTFVQSKHRGCLTDSKLTVKVVNVTASSHEQQKQNKKPRLKEAVTGRDEAK